MWYETKPARFKAELDGITALAAGQAWLKSFNVRLDKASKALLVDIDLQVGENLRPVTLAYPEGFPHTPPSIKPRGETVTWTGHQYGAGGELCLEHRPDNWEPQITGVDMIQSVYKLLDSEAGKDEGGKPLTVESAHRSTAGQSMRTETSRFVATASMLQRIALCEKPMTAAFRLSANSQSLVYMLHHVIEPDGSKWIDPELPPGLGEYTTRKGFILNLGVDYQQWSQIPKADQTGAAAMRDSFIGPDAGLFDGKEIVLVAVGPFLFAYRLDPDDDKVAHLGVIDPESGKRMLDDNATLATKKVAILGAGSMGSKVAESLARSGVRKFVLMDEDVVMPGNMVRHALDWGAVGHHKVKALEDKLNLLAPGIEVEAWPFDLGGQNSVGLFDRMIAALTKCDMIVDATGSANAFNYASVVAVDHSKPMAWARVFGGGYGGLIARSRPGLEPAPPFARAAIDAWCANPEFPKAPKEITDYGATGEGGEPMIADDADVSAIAAHFTRLIIDTLIAPEKSVFASSAYMIGLREEWIFKAAFDTRPIDLGAPHIPPAEIALPEHEAATAAAMLATLKSGLAEEGE